MKKLLLLGLILFCRPCMASVPESPIVSHDDPNDEREFQNVYQAIANPTINSATISSATIANQTVTNSTVTNLTLGGNLNANSFKITNLANGSAATDAVAFGQMKVFQIQMGTATTSFSTTSSGFQTTNLSVTITPTSTTHRIMLLAMGVGQDGPGWRAFFTMTRGGTNLGGSNGFLQMNADVASVLQSPVTMIYVDSPASSGSPIVYDVRLKNNDNNAGHTVFFGVDTAQTQVMIAVEIGS